MQVCTTYHQFRADRAVVEKNFGGIMVETTIRQVTDYGGAIPIKMVQASRDKVIRAEPVVALYEQHRVHHVGVHPGLEDQMCNWIPDTHAPSPDRLDAMVWAITELLVDQMNLDLEIN